MTAAEWLIDNGYENVVIIDEEAYDSALVGVSDENRAIYDFDKMVEGLQVAYGWSDTEAIEWIEYNTMRALPYQGEAAPIIMYPRRFDE